MRSLIEENAEERMTLFIRCSQLKNIPLDMIEKDFWSAGR